MICVLSIAGSDSGGGAGIQADLKAFSAQGTYGMTAITALTAQNTLGVQAVQPVDPVFVGAQIDSIFEDFEVAAVKVGMLPNLGVIEVVAERLAKYKPRWLVVDPVMVAKGGQSLMDKDAVSAFRQLILPLCDVITPNLPEAAALVGFLPHSVDDMERAGRALLTLGARAALVKGGHLEGRPDDLLVSGSGTSIFRGERLDSRHTHGTGCSLSSALAALLAKGEPLETAVKHAKHYVAEGIRRAPGIGGGVGPIHHFWNLWKEGSES